MDFVLLQDLAGSAVMPGIIAALLGWELSTIVLLVIGCCVVDALYSKYWHPLAKHPGPFWAGITNLWRFVTFFGGQHHLIDQRLHELYGPVVRIGPNSLSFSTLEAYESIYGFRSTMIKGDWYQVTRDTDSVHSPLIGITNNQEHRAQRKKVLNAAFASSKVATYRPVIERYNQRLLIELEELYANASMSVIDLTDVIHHHAFETLYEVAYGQPAIYPTPEDRKKNAQGIQNANKGLGAGYLPWLGKFLSWKPIAKLIRRPVYSKTGQLVGFTAIARQSFERVLEQQNAVMESSQPSILHNLLLVPENDEKRLPLRIIALEAFNMLFAGPGTTAAALLIMLFKLAQPQGQQWQDRIRDECIAQGSQNSQTLSAVAKETLRLFPPFPSSFPRTTSVQATTIEYDQAGATVVVPKNTTVSCNLYVLGMSKHIWGDDVDEWKPQRWLDRDDVGMTPEISGKTGDQKSTMRNPGPEERFIPFGKGPRSCIGREISMILIAETLATILDQYQLTSAVSLQGKNFFEMQYTECSIKMTRR